MSYLILFLEFFKTGLFALGGGLATLPFLYEMADRYPWFDTNTLANMIAVSESTPGAIGVNMATYAGLMAGGIVGGLISTAGLVMPSIIVIILVSKVLERFKTNKYVQDGFYGLRPAVTGLIAAAGMQIVRISLLQVNAFAAGTSIVDWFAWKNVVLLAIILFLVLKFKKHPVLYIALGAVAGIVFSL